ncbi:hypothetical protein ABPG77_002938 [Micractinium sp. CCAP 211/92]
MQQHQAVVCNFLVWLCGAGRLCQRPCWVRSGFLMTACCSACCADCCMALPEPSGQQGRVTWSLGAQDMQRKQFAQPLNPSKIFHTSVPPATMAPPQAATSATVATAGGVPPHRLPCSTVASIADGTANRRTLALHARRPWVVVALGSTKQAAPADWPARQARLVRDKETATCSINRPVPGCSHDAHLMHSHASLASPAATKPAKRSNCAG